MQEEKLTFQQVSDRFGVPIRTLFRWQNRIEPKDKRNKPSTKIDMEALAKDVKDNPDDFQYEYDFDLLKGKYEKNTRRKRIRCL